MSEKKIKASLAIINKNDCAGLERIYFQIPIEELYEVFVIDGQSTDHTVDFCRKHAIRCIVQDKLGRGDAFRLAAREAKGDSIIFLSSDGNENPTDIPKFIQLLEQGNDLVIASRLAKGAHNKDDGRFFPIRKWMLYLFTLIVNIAWKSNLTDVWNGYRAFNKDKFQKLPTTANNNLIELQQTIRALKRGYKVAEFPSIEGPRIAGKTQNPLLKTGIGLIGILLEELIHYRNNWTPE